MKHHNKKRNYFILILICWNLINSILIAKAIDSLSIPEIQTKTTPVIVLDSDSELEQQLQEEYQFELLDKLY